MPLIAQPLNPPLVAACACDDGCERCQYSGEVLTPAGQAFMARLEQAIRTNPLRLQTGRFGRFTLSSERVLAGERDYLGMRFGELPLPCDADRYVLTEELPDGRHIVWMASSPAEMVSHYEPIDRARGRVLTAGLGLGYFAMAAAAKPDVTDVTVIEQSDDVIRLIWPQLQPQSAKLSLRQGDAFRVLDALAQEGQRYDLIYLNIWPDNRAAHLWELIVPLKAKARRLLSPGGHLLCWVEDEIRQMALITELLPLIASGPPAMLQADPRLANHPFVGPFLRQLAAHPEWDPDTVAREAGAYARSFGGAEDP